MGCVSQWATIVKYAKGRNSQLETFELQGIKDRNLPYKGSRLLSEVKVQSNPHLSNICIDLLL